jgi:hypothetical protein
MDLAARHVDASLRSSCSAAVGPPASRQSVGMYLRASQSVSFQLLLQIAVHIIQEWLRY